MRYRSILACFAAVSFCSAASADTFTFTIENVGVQPITPVFVATHDSTFDIFDEGGTASAELIAIAEEGMTGPMEALAGGAAGVLDFGVGAFIGPGESTSVTVTADLDHPYLSFAAMLPVTNDAFIGLAYTDDALDLFRLGGPQFYDFTLSYLEVWDAGSELNTELAVDVPALGGSGSPDEGGVIFKPHPGILGVGDIGPEFDFWGLDIAHITVVPEPGAWLLLGLAGLAVARRRR
jgi:hypothetical protein